MHPDFVQIKKLLHLPKHHVKNRNRRRGRMPKQLAYLVFNFYGRRNKPLCVVIANSIEEAIRQTGGEPIRLWEGEFQVCIPFEKCTDSGYRGHGAMNTFLYKNGPIELEIDQNFFSHGVLALVEIPLLSAAS